MLIKEFLEKVCDEIKYKPIRKDISEELELHIQEQKEEFVKDGMSNSKAEEKAVLNMGEATEIGKKLDKIHRPKLDWILLLLVAILIGFGFLVTVIKSQRMDMDYYLIRHVIFCVVGLIFSIIIYFYDYRKYLKYSNFIYFLSSILLIDAILFGYKIVGTYKYINIFSVGIDPSNICILLYIVYFVSALENLKSKKCKINIDNFTFEFRIDILKLVILSSISIILLMSASGITISVILIMAYIIILTSYIINTKNNVKLNLIKLYGILFIIGIIFLVFCIGSQNAIYYRLQNKIVSTYNYEKDINGNGWIGYKINEVLNNSNMFSGLDNMDSYFGLFDGGTNHALITIIAYCGSAYALIIISTIILLTAKIIIYCKKIKDNYGKQLIIGLSSVILLQAIFNILMNFNIIPITNLNLPFISYGITSLIINMISIAFILSIYRRKDILVKERIK